MCMTLAAYYADLTQPGLSLEDSEAEHLAEHKADASRSMPARHSERRHPFINKSRMKGSAAEAAACKFAAPVRAARDKI